MGLAKVATPPGAAPDSAAIMDCIRQIVHALHVGSHAAQKYMGLSGAQLFVLQTLAAGESMSVNELAARTHTHQSSVSGVLSRLMEAKLVRRTISPTDARRAEVSVTASGRQLLETTIVTPQQRVLEALNRLDSVRLRTFRELLENLVHDSGIGADVVPMFFEHTTTKQK